MTLSIIRKALAVSVFTALTACGGNSTQVAPSLQAAAASPTVTVAATTGLPVPDCQPENCAGLRIIDGNAEAYRADAMRRAALEAKG